MKHTKLFNFRLVLFSAALLGSVPLDAADSIEAHWVDLCHISQEHTLTVMTADGSTIEGLCVMVDVDQMSIQTRDRGVVKVARNVLSHVEMFKQRQSRGHELKRLAHNVDRGLNRGVDWLFSPLAPAGIVTIPATLAWGAISLPFCAIADLKNKIAHTGDEKQEIKVI